MVLFTVKLPELDVVPIITVPAVILARSADVTLNVLPVLPTEMDLFPLGIRDTRLFPALTDPEKLTSLAVIVIGAFVVDIEVEPALVTLPVPLVVMVTPVVPVALALSATAPFEPDDVCSTNELPDRVLDVVMVPLPVNVRMPLVEVMAPDVPMVAEAPVVVMEKLPPTVDVLIVTAPLLTMLAVPGLPVLALSSGAAVRIGVPAVPILPVSEARLTEPEVKVTAPDLVIAPEPLAVMLMRPRFAVETLALIAILALPASVPNKITPLPLKESALAIVSVLPEVTETMPEVPLTVPRLTVPVALMVKFLAPRIML